MAARRILVLAPHADDEVLGVGGAMARWAAEGHEVTVVVVTRGQPPLFTVEEEDRCQEEARSAHRLLGVAHTRFLDLEAGALDRYRHRELNAHLEEAVRAAAPDEVYLPFPGDLHLDHQLVFHSAMVALRPNRPGYPRGVFAYETLSETNWNAAHCSPAFLPTHYLDISGFLEAKLRAFACYQTQVRPAPHERSLEAVQALALLRGATVGLAAAEATVTIRTVA
jgi:LmbE family N-acetylglucosaminyl deacetylase